ncbi:hypothetical protein ACTWP6_23715 [Mycobacterium sp. 4D054]|uniref:hypothetical protein n=1 Tax=Mycobacterium sp. 4D054 TaxID=3457440 RepID=UPI003FD5F7E4
MLIEEQRRDEPNGLVVVERFYGEEFGSDLLSRIASTPEDQLLVLAEILHEWRERSWKSRSARSLAKDAVIEPRVALFDQLPIAARPNIENLLLLAPQVVVNDPIAAWAEMALRKGEARAWPARQLPFGQDALAGRSRDVLLAVLGGLRPVAGLIAAGEILLVAGERSPRSSALAGHHLDNSRYAARGLVMDGFPIGEEGALSDKARNNELLELAEHFVSLGSMTNALPIPTGMEYLFNGPFSAEAMALTIPKLELSVSDAILMRRGEEVFKHFRDALREVLLSAGAGLEGESPVEYGERLRAAAERHLAQVEDELRVTVSRGKLFGLVPGAASGVARLTTGAIDLTLPGATFVASKATRKLVSRKVAAGAAAESALRYTANLKLTGRL